MPSSFPTYIFHFLYLPVKKKRESFQLYTILTMRSILEYDFYFLVAGEIQTFCYHSEMIFHLPVQHSRDYEPKTIRLIVDQSTSKNVFSDWHQHGNMFPSS